MALSKIFTKIFGSRNDRLIRSMQKTVDQINGLEEQMQALSDEQLQAKTEEFKQRLQAGESLDALLPEAFAVVREAAVRTLGMRHYDVQMIGGMVLHDGKIAEMRTGEGKTLVATLPAYLNALTGKGVHIVTVNDYLARRDAEWMQPVYEFLGMKVGVVVPDMDHAAKRAAYAADITYGTNNEFGFDYLRDNMAFSLEDRVQRELHYAIVDEVDSILIDEARTPLIISGPADDSPELYHRVNRLVPALEKGESFEDPNKPPTGDFTVDEKTKQVYLTEQGMEKIEQICEKEGLIQPGESLYDPQHLSLMHHINAALRAHHLYQKDVDYIVQDGEVVIVDEFTGRTLAGRRWSDGLHQAVEAKEGVAVQKENQTLASVTFQNYFRLYEKLAGMTGTADTEAYEFHTIYGLEVVVIPTHKPAQRKDEGDLVYLTQAAKYKAILDDIRDAHERGQPVLVGTASIDVSELLSDALKKAKIPHNVLNAKQHEREAQIIAEAGKPGAVTIATNMAGRGTDIVLGGNLKVELEALGENASPEAIEKLKADWQKRHDAVLAAGGLRIIGTERHESRRIDNQLRGRSGRQGDPGSSRFYVSLEDNLMRIFGQDRIANTMRRMGMQEDEAVEHPLISRSIESAQRKVEGHNFDIRKNLLEYDDVANDQRLVIYQQRADLLAADDIKEFIDEIRQEVFDNLVRQYIPEDSIDEQWDIAGLERTLAGEFGIELNIQRWVENDEELDDRLLREKVLENVNRFYREKEAMTGSEVMRHFEKAVYLNVLDQLWKEHLANMDYLRQGIGLRGYAQKQPVQEYKREAFEMFRDLLDRIKLEVMKIIAQVKVREEEDVETMERQREAQRQQHAMEFQHQRSESAIAGQPAAAEKPETFVRQGKKIGRNEPCPCGSGKKYKQCHGRLQ